MKFKSQSKSRIEDEEEDDKTNEQEEDSSELNFPKLPSKVILEQLKSIDFDTEYGILLEALEAKGSKINIDMSGLAFRAYRLLVRSKEDVRLRKDALGEAELAVRARVIGKAAGNKVTEATIKNMVDADAKVKLIKMHLRKAEDVQDVCEGLAKAMGIKKEFVKYER